MDSVAHLAVVAEEGDPWNILDVCIKGLTNVLEACVRQGVARVVIASSINAMGCGGLQHSVPAPLYVPVDEEHPCWPELYGKRLQADERAALCPVHAPLRPHHRVPAPFTHRPCGTAHPLPRRGAA